VSQVFIYTCIIQYVHHSKMIGEGKLIEGLYVIETDSLVFDNQTVDKGLCSTVTIANVLSSHTWHNKLLTAQTNDN